tara:strand:- start:717 stop:1721 length:1005 start_codon:yes stop_codon:yes gene_type:complete
MSTKNELSTEDWLSVFSQARDMGCVQLGLTGGEPLMRNDLTTLVKEARAMGFYTNLITSAVGLTRKKIDVLKMAGLDSVQISFQAENRQLNEYIGGKDTYDKKVDMMRAVKEAGMPLTLNVVIHRLNIDRMPDICKFCDSMNPDHVEIASVQYHGWANTNRRQLLPTPEQVQRAQKAIETYQQSSTSGVYYVLPDLIEKRAKPCQQGWGTTYICINPQGNVTPCLSAHTLPSVKSIIPNVRKHTLEAIWNGEVFSKYRGIDWMTEGAKHHPRRDEDLGGCRCQTFLLTGNECAMDPVDDTSVHHDTFQRRVMEDYSTPVDLKSLLPRRVATTPR